MRRRIPDEVWLFCIALAVRALYFVLHSSSIYFDRPILDSLWIHQWAESIAKGAGSGSEAYFRAPLYPFAVAGIYRLCGAHAAVVAALQHVLGAGAVVLLYRLGRRLVDRRTGVIAALLLSFYWIAIFFEGELLIASSALFLALFLLNLLAGLDVRAHRNRRLLGIGLVLGVAIIARPNFLVLLPLAIIWPLIGRRSRPRAWREVLIVLCATALPIMPVTVRNVVVADDFVWVASQGGLNLYVGNGPQADGKTAMSPGETGPMRRDQIEHDFRDNITLAGRKIAEQESGSELKASEVSNFWAKRTWDEVRSRPGRAVGLLLRKSYFFLNGFEISNNKDLTYAQSECGLWAFAPVRLVWVLPFAWLGLFVIPRRARWLLGSFVALYGFSVVLFFISARFRLPVAPAIFLIAGAGIGNIWNWIIRWRAGDKPYADIRARRLALGAGIVILGSIISLVRLAHIDDHRGRPAFRLNHATLLAETGRWDEALAAYDAARELEPVRVAATYGRARALERSGRTEEAAAAYLDITRENPGFTVAHLAQARLLAQLGRLGEADGAHRAALSSNPEMPETHFGYAQFLLDQRRFTLAATAYREGLRLRPGDLKAWMNLGYALASGGDYSEAIAAWEEVLRIDPTSEMARGNIERARGVGGE